MHYSQDIVIIYLGKKICYIYIHTHSLLLEPLPILPLKSQTLGTNTHGGKTNWVIGKVFIMLILNNILIRRNLLTTPQTKGKEKLNHLFLRNRNSSHLITFFLKEF